MHKAVEALLVRTRAHGHAGQGLAVLLCLGLVYGCAEPIVSPHATPGVTTAAQASAVPIETFQEWVAFRRAYGLRSDSDWIYWVAAQPQSRNETGVPLLAEEQKAMAKAIRANEPVIDVLTEYGERHPDLYAGIWADGARMVILLKGDVTEHAAVLAMLLPDARFEVRSAQWSTADLRNFVAQVEADRAWFESIGAELETADISDKDSSVRVRYRSASDAVGTLILSHFNSPEWMDVRHVGARFWTGALGTMSVSVVDGAGRAIEGAHCSWSPTDASVDGNSAEAFVTGTDGVCTNRYLPAPVTYRVVVSFQPASGPKVSVEGFGTTKPDNVTRVRLVLKP